MEQYWLLIPLGIMVGSFGTLIGAGGGFVLVPVLLFISPHADPETITSISLAVVFFNALSGSWAYARMKRIDYKSGLLFATATVPGAIIGVLSTQYISRQLFDAVFGFLLIAVAIYLFIRPLHENKSTDQKNERHIFRKIVEKNGSIHAFSYDLKLGMGLSLFVGYISSLLGIGGGIIHVPALVRLLHFPVHIATATSHFILAITALTGTIVHIISGSFSHESVLKTVFLGIGVLAGAQAGALFSSRVGGRWIIRGLAAALGLVGIRILVMALKG